MELSLTELALQVIPGIVGGVVFSFAIKRCHVPILLAIILGALGGFALSEIVNLLVATAPPSEAAATSLSGFARHIVLGFFGGAALTAATGFGRRYLVEH